LANESTAGEFKARFNSQELNEGEFLFMFADVFVELVQYGKRTGLCDLLAGTYILLDFLFKISLLTIKWRLLQITPGRMWTSGSTDPTICATIPMTQRRLDQDSGLTRPALKLDSSKQHRK
jgi:hypothetical protein